MAGGAKDSDQGKDEKRGFAIGPLPVLNYKGKNNYSSQSAGP